MKKFDFFNQYRDPVIIIKDYEDVVFKNNTFCRVFPSFEDIRKFAHKITSDICILDSENVDLFSPIFQAINSKENYFSRISYIPNSNSPKIYYDLTAIKRGLYTIIVLVDVNSEILLNDNIKIQENYKKELQELKKENEELQDIRQKAQSQAIRIALINKVSNQIRESMDLSAILHSTLKELSTMFACFRAYYAGIIDKSLNFKIEQVYGEDRTDSEITFDDDTLCQLNQKKVAISNSMLEYVNAEPFKQSVLKIIVPVFHLQKMIGVIVLLSYQKRELNEEIEILEAISSQLGDAIIKAELYQKNIQNVKELKETLKELKETQLQLINSEKMVSLGQLVAGVAHEINTPVASIKSNNSIFSKIIPQIQQEDLSQMLQELNNLDKEAIERITNIVSSLKKFVRLDESELQLANINKELDLTLNLIRHETKNKVEIIKNYGDIPEIKCYPNMLNQVFTNLLVNACQAIETKGQIIISTAFNNSTLTVKIKDNGIGIPKENLSKIFNAGFTTKGVGVGTGLGLAICQKIIEKHNGKIEVNSVENIGTEFIITISCE